MRSFRLAQIAAEAEILRLKRLGRRTAIRAIFAAVALVFFLAVLVGIHVALAIWLLPRLGAMNATLIVLAGDAVIMIIFGLLAAITGPGTVEREALAVRESARLQLVQAAAAVSMIAPLSRLLGNRSIFRLILAAMMAKMFTSQSRR